MDEFFSLLLELIQSKSYCTDIPSVPSGIIADAPQSNDKNVEKACVAHSSEFKSVTEAESIVTNLEQLSSTVGQYYFSASLCSKFVKPPPSHGQLEHPRLDGQGATEHVVTINGFAKH